MRIGDGSLRIIATCVVTMAVLGCGRVNFASSTDDASADDAARGDAVACGSHDEDGDGVADNCDNCPTFANIAQLDIEEIINGANADGVGDACDPRPTLAGDYITFFDACNVPSANFMEYDGATFADDGVLIGGPTSGGTVRLLFRDKLTRAELRFTIIESGNSGTQWVGLWYRESNIDRRGVLASINRAIGATPATADIDETPLTGGNRLSNSLDVAPVLLPMMEFQMVVDTARLTKGDDVMRLVSNSTTPPVNGSETLAITVSDINGDPYLEASRVIARFHYLVLYASKD